MLAPVDFTRKVSGSKLVWDIDFTEDFMVLLSNSRQIKGEYHIIRPLSLPSIFLPKFCLLIFLTSDISIPLTVMITKTNTLVQSAFHQLSHIYAML